MKPRIIISIALALGAVYYFQNNSETEELVITRSTEAPAPPLIEPALKLKPTTIKKMEAKDREKVQIASPPPPQKSVAPSPPPKNDKASTKEPEDKVPTIPYVVEDGLAVTQGDIVLGLPPEDGLSSGVAILAPLRLWPSRQIAYHIQPDVSDPSRVEEALDLFAGTVIEFVPYKDQEDVMIFETGQGTCKSYVGHIGGKQPLWIPPGCTPADIAHEILHALGLVHEQNRADRDQYIEVLYDNVEERHAINFEKFPDQMMRVSGLGEFDFSSLMIYPPSMFARTGHSTMRPRNAYEEIRPSQGLSPIDRQRVNEAYGSREPQYY